MLWRMRLRVVGSDQELVEDGCAMMDISDCTDYPTYYSGILEAAAELAGGKRIVVKVMQAHPPGALYEVRWE